MKKAFSDLKYKDEIDLGAAFKNYLESSVEIYSKIKTLLYRHEPKDIYSFYECVGVSKENGEIIDASSINNILDIGEKLIVTGTGGSGKSVMMKHLYLDTIKNTKLIPIFVELRGLNDLNYDNINLVEYIYNIMCTLEFKLEKEYFEYSLEEGCNVILLDGFDELKNGLSEIVTRKIFEFANKYSKNYYLISSRPSTEFVSWNQFEELEALPLNKKQALSLIKKLDYNTKIKEKFLEELDTNLFEKYNTFASNPLLLTIMLLTFEKRSSMPDRLSDFFEQAFATLFHEHDTTSKSGFTRDILSDLGYEDFRTVFSHFCFKSFFNSDYEFTKKKVLDYITDTKNKNIISKQFNEESYLKDLTQSVCMLVHEGLDYRFTHRAFQEYFAAVYTVQLNDRQQERFIKAWLTEDDFRPTSSFLDMLYDLQPQRFSSNVIIPAIKELKRLFDKNGNSLKWLISVLVKSCILINKENETRYAISTSNYYYLDMIIRTCKINQFKNEKSFEKISSEKKLISIIENNYGSSNEVSINKLFNDGYEKEVIDGLQWLIDRFYFAVNFSNLNSSSINSKKFANMLEEL